MPYKSCFGVIAGGVLSPQLFNDFLSDLGDNLDSECGVKLDKKLLLYLLFNIFYNYYCAKWHLVVKLVKTKVVIYNSAYAFRNCVFENGDEVFEIVNIPKYGAQTKTNYLKTLHILIIRRLKLYLQYKIIVLRHLIN